jgi:DNA-binding HxlR family transcriptional regulator
LVTAEKKLPKGNSPRRLNPVDGCPLTAALAAIGGKWKLIIVYWLAESPRHFAALRQLIPGLSSKVLTQQLRELENDGIVDRIPTGPMPCPVVYSLTHYGRSVLPLAESMRLWGRDHLEHTVERASS